MTNDRDEGDISLLTEDEFFHILENGSDVISEGIDAIRINLVQKILLLSRLSQLFSKVRHFTSDQNEFDVLPTSSSEESIQKMKVNGIDFCTIKRILTKTVH